MSLSECELCGEEKCVSQSVDRGSEVEGLYEPVWRRF